MDLSRSKSVDMSPPHSLKKEETNHCTHLKAGDNNTPGVMQSSLSSVAAMLGSHGILSRTMASTTTTVLAPIMAHRSFNEPPTVDSTSANSVIPPSSPGWCITSSVSSQGSIEWNPIAGYEETSHQSHLQPVGDKLLDLTKSADWMEYLEHTEGRWHDEGGAGAYDTMRCDLILSHLPNQDFSTSPFRIWGQDYHLWRLYNSYRSLLHVKQKTPLLPEPVLNSRTKEHLDEALMQSRQTIQQLLSEAAQYATTKSNGKHQDDATENSNHNTNIQLIRVTLLWSPSKHASNPQQIENTDSQASPILVRGHAASSLETISIHKTPKSIVVTVAAHSEHGNDGDRVIVDTDIPTRFDNPQSKVASWCRQRKQMENPTTYKPPGVSEVLMVKPRKDESGIPRLEVLEGLSSNFFVIYDDGCLRTATEGVLHGYVRHLVLECASECDLKFDPRPIFLHEADQWKEAFITSSSRLIYPISTILLPEDENQMATSTPSFVKLWNDSISVSSDIVAAVDEAARPQWKALLDEILRAGGYES